MSRETEKIFKEFHDFLEENSSDDMDEEKVDALFQNFMEQYNAHLPQSVTEKNAKTADDFLELAENTKDETNALKYAQKALQMEPDNLDAERIIAEITAKDALDLLGKLEQAVKHGTEVMSAKGYMSDDSIGYYWGITATRPYMRLRQEYMETLKDCGMIRKAVAECEEMIRLCENDNLGVRYTLMHLYAFLEEEEAALKLHEKYDKYEETQMLLPLSIIYYKLYQMDKAAEYLKRLAKVNKDTKKFFRAIRNNRLEQYMDAVSPYGYQPFSIEELMMELMGNQFLFAAVPEYLRWADMQLVVKRK